MMAKTQQGADLKARTGWCVQTVHRNRFSLWGRAALARSYHQPSRRNFQKANNYPLSQTDNTNEM